MHQGIPSVLGTPSLSRRMLTSIILFTRLWANWPQSTQTKRTSIPVLYKQQSNTLHTVHRVYHYGKGRFLASRFLHSNNTQHAQKLQCGPMLMSVHFSPFPVPWIWFMLQHVHWPQSSKKKKGKRDWIPVAFHNIWSGTNEFWTLSCIHSKQEINKYFIIHEL